jgi:hypothetical protein
MKWTPTTRAIQGTAYSDRPITPLISTNPPNNAKPSKPTMFQ